MLHSEIKSEMQKAMREQDALRLGALRMLLSGITNALVEQGKKPSDELEDDAVIAVVRRSVKQRGEAAEQYRSAGMEEKAKAEEDEAAVLRAYLPPEMSREEVVAVVTRIKDELGVREKKDKGTLMKSVMAELKGRVGGGVVVSVIDDLLV